MLTNLAYKQEPLDQESEIIWQPHVGSQTLFLTCPYREVLYDGTRGPGKTDALLMDFAQHCGKGYGENWRGILFRETFPQLKEVIFKSNKFFKRIFPKADYNKSEHIWTWPEGEVLIFSYMKDPRDYWNYHGHEYPWIGWEELCNWKDDRCYELMKACNRSSHPGMPRRYVSTTNPYGKGWAWVKEWFVDPVPAGIPILGKKGWPRCRIQGFLFENTHLVENDPEYVDTIRNTKDPNLRKAWWGGSWDIVAGGAISDVWNENIHFIPPFHIPTPWYVNRSFDWGSTSPFSVGWWAESNGEKVQISKGKTKIFPRGTLFRIAEFYGWTGEANKGNRMHASAIAKKILQKEAYLLYNGRVRAGPADNQIYNSDRTLAADMAAAGVNWIPADQSGGSRVAGLEAIRSLLTASAQKPMEDPGLFIFNTCAQWKRTVPGLPRDEKDLDDVDTETEDHCYIGDTLIETDKGLSRIKDMVGMTGKVLTIGNRWIDYFGVRKTRNDTDLVKVEFENGEIIICTNDETFLTTNLQLKNPLDLSDETCYSLLNANYNRRKLCKSEKLAILYKNLMGLDIINVGIISRTMVGDFIEKFGITITAQLIKDLKYIIKMKINQITKLITLNLYYQKSIANCMGNYFIKEERNKIGLKQCMMELNNGMVALKGKNGINYNMKNIVGMLLPKLLQNYVFVVMNLLRQDIQIKQNSVLFNVKLNGEDYKGQIMRDEYVNGVKRNSKLTNMRKQDFVQSLVQGNIMQNKDMVTGLKVRSVAPVGKGDVYCLIADGIHLFAVGKSKIIASNCYDETRYRVLTKKIITTSTEV